ncbi:MAG: DUF4336 domain-containing protein [Rubrobacteraceae bacterium]
MKLYEPLNTLKPLGEDFWIVDGPLVRMSSGLGFRVPFPTRMAVVRLSGGELFLWSPTEPESRLRGQIAALGPVRHLVSPNKLHYAHVGAWKHLYPEATAWASPGVRERAASQGIEVDFDADLADAPDPAWSEDLDQLIFRGSRFLEEVVFFHRKTKTLILADLIENFEPKRTGPAFGWLARLAGAAHPDGKTPIDLRATFLGRKEEARRCFGRMLGWEPERVILAHGRPYYRNGVSELRRTFRWLK